MDIRHAGVVSYKDCTASTGFKSAYPVYHWQKVGNEITPVFDIGMVKRFQRFILKFLNTSPAKKNVKSKKLGKKVSDFFSRIDPDYKVTKFAKTYYNNDGGIKYAWNGNVCSIKPTAFMITGQDAVDFHNMYGKPIGYAKAEYFDKENPHSIYRDILKEAGNSYRYNGECFVETRAKKFADKHPEGSDLHVVFGVDPKKDTIKLFKIGFYKRNGVENPFEIMGYR